MKQKKTYLDKVMDMAVHKLMGRDASKRFKIVCSNNGMGLHQSNPSIGLDIGCLGAHFLFPLAMVFCLFRRGVISYKEVVREAVLMALGTKTAGETETPFSTTQTTSSLGSKGTCSSWPSSWHTSPD